MKKKRVAGLDCDHINVSWMCHGHISPFFNELSSEQSTSWDHLTLSGVNRLKKAPKLTAAPCQVLHLLRHWERCVPAHPAKSALPLWQVGHWGKQRWARADTRWLCDWISVSTMKWSSDELMERNQFYCQNKNNYICGYQHLWAR